ncbi:MAG: ATP-binding protein [Eubacteriales bacterium]|nr:ATP-binding protein [Eubacteriales bacterium]
MRALTVENLLDKKYEFIEFSGTWYEAFSRPVIGGSWFIYGGSSNGKTSFVAALIKELATLGRKVLYLSLEEQTDHTLQQAAIKAGWAECGDNIRIIEPESYSELSARLAKRKSYDVIVIDTIQYFDMTFKQYLNIKRKYPNKLFVFVSHVQKNGKDPDGSVALKIMRDASLKIWIEGFRAISKGRYIGPLGFFTIWKEGAEKYWLDQTLK